MTGTSKRPTALELATLPLFANFDHADLERIAEKFRTLVFDRGDVLLRRGTRGPRVLAFLVLAAGTADAAADGDAPRPLRRGDCAGAIALLDEVPQPATVTARTRLRCFGLSAWEFRGLLERHPALCSRIRETADLAAAAA